MAFCRKPAFSLLPLGPYQENWNNISLLPNHPPRGRGKFYGEGAGSCYRWVQTGLDLGGVGAGRIVFCMQRGVTQLDISLNSLINSQETATVFLKINRDHIPHRKAALGSPEVYSPAILRCFGFSSENMVLWEQSVYGRRMAFTWRGREPEAKLTHFCTVCFACQSYSSQTLGNPFWFPILFDFCGAFQENIM